MGMNVHKNMQSQRHMSLLIARHYYSTEHDTNKHWRRQDVMVGGQKVRGSGGRSPPEAEAFSLI